MANRALDNVIERVLPGEGPVADRFVDKVLEQAFDGSGSWSSISSMLILIIILGGSSYGTALIASVSALYMHAMSR
jgi:hypothetical protein